MSNNDESSLRGEGAPVPSHEMQVQPLPPAPFKNEPLREVFLPATVGDLALLETDAGWLLGTVVRHTKPGRIMFLSVAGQERRVKDSDYTRLAPMRQCAPELAQALLATRGATPYTSWVEARDDLDRIRLKT